MKVAFLVTRLEKPSARYRVAQFLPYLRGHGVESDVLRIPKSLFERRRLFNKLIHYDIVVTQKKLFGRGDLRRIRSVAKRLAYDFDDAVIFDERGKENRRRLARFAQVCEAADIVICGNKYLHELASRYTGRTVILPTSIDTEKFAPSGKERPGEKIVLGWIGSHSTLKYLIDIMPALELLSKNHPGTTLKIICDTFPEGCPLPMEKKVWSLESELADLQEIDIGLMPLRDDPWCRGKCGFKILQYFSIARAVVCSPVGVNRDIVDDGVNGFWADGPDKWADKLARLIDERELRGEFGRRGREKVVREYSLKAAAPKLEKILRDLAGE